ncbi:MAG TPA: bifunctional nuclease family protein [Candidatus Latescibacteria bacterium]|nr:bifunctional nuclease family protein [Candidatus Latescibacterota bacterium]
MKRLFFVAASLVFVACSDEQAGLVSDDLIPARITDVIDYGADGVAVVLKGKDSPPVLIVIGHCEARALMVAIQDEDFPRPLSYDLLEEILENVDGEVTRLVVHSLKDNTYYANLYIDTPNGEWVLDCRPSDGMVLVTRLGAPIYLKQHIFEREMQKPQA